MPYGSISALCLLRHKFINVDFVALEVVRCFGSSFLLQVKQFVEVIEPLPLHGVFDFVILEVNPEKVVFLFVKFLFVLVVAVLVAGALVILGATLPCLSVGLLFLLFFLLLFQASLGFFGFLVGYPLLEVFLLLDLCFLFG